MRESDAELKSLKWLDCYILKKIFGYNSENIVRTVMLPRLGNCNEQYIGIRTTSKGHDDLRSGGPSFLKLHGNVH